MHEHQADAGQESQQGSSAAIPLLHLQTSFLPPISPQTSPTTTMARQLPLPIPPKSPRRLQQSGRSPVASTSRISETGFPRSSSSSHGTPAESPSLPSTPNVPFFDALSSPAVTPSLESRTGPSLSPSLATPTSRTFTTSNTQQLTSQSPPRLAHRRPSDRTSALPAPSDQPNSQRRRRHRRNSNESAVSSSAASASSAALADLPDDSTVHHHGETTASSDISAPSLSPRLRAIRVSEKHPTRSNPQVRQASPSSLSQWHSRHATDYVPPDRYSQATMATQSSSTSRARTSQATAYGPFDLETAQAGTSSLQQDFLDAIGRPAADSDSDGLDTASRLSMPSTAYSLDTLHCRSRPESNTGFVSSPVSPTTDTVYRGSQYHDDADYPSIRLVDGTPPAPSAAGWRADLASQMDRLDTTRRDSTQTTAQNRRTGRIFSTSTVSAYSQDDPRTPRLSLSHQGRMADSMYSTAGTVPDQYPPESASQSLDDPARQDLQAQLSARSFLDISSVLDKDPEAARTTTASARDSASFIDNRSSVYSDAHMSMSSKHTSGSFSVDEDSLPPTPVSKDYRNSLLSLSSLSSLLDETLQTSPNMSTEPDKRVHKQLRIFQELLQTEESFARDVVLVRDVWLARARGKDMADIMSSLETYERASPRDSMASSSVNLPAAVEVPRSVSIPSMARKSSAPQMQRDASQGSTRSIKGIVGSFSVGRAGKSRQSASILEGMGRPGSQSANYALPPGAALHAPMSPSDVQCIFNNVADIATFSEDFLRHLEPILPHMDYGDDEGLKVLDIAKAFDVMLPRMSTVFSSYCSKFGDALSRWEIISGSLADYIRDCKDLCHGYTNAWDLPSLLIKPVQRCLKYPLFLQSLLDSMADDDPDKSPLRASLDGLLKVAESINEMKRRQEIVSKLIKPKSRPSLYPSSRRPSQKALPQSGKSVSGHRSLSATLGKRLRKTSRVSIPDGLEVQPPPESDGDFEQLSALMQRKHQVIQSFIVDSKSWSKAIRASLVAQLQLCVTWKTVSTLGSLDKSEPSVRSGRLIDQFAIRVIKVTVEEQWHDLDQEIRKVLVPRAQQLLEQFAGPQAVIDQRYYRYREGRSKAAAKEASVLREHATVYEALNSQLKEELPKFLDAVDSFFTAIFQRFVSLQTAFHGRMQETWTEYMALCCTQLGDPDQSMQDSVATWWRVHKPLVQQLDNLKILAADRLVQDVQRRQRDSLPASLRPREVSMNGHRASAPGQTLPRRESGHQAHRSEDNSRRPESVPIPPIPRQPSQYSSSSGQNRHSAFSTASAGSMSFSGNSVSSTTSPSTPALEQSVLWQGAVAQSFRPDGQRVFAKGFGLLACEPGDLFDVLDEHSGEKYLLVRQEHGDIGWLPAHLLHRLD